MFLFFLIFYCSLSLYKAFSIATGYFLTEESVNQDAKCLDGSPPLYYYIEGQDEGMEKWLIYFQGGAWCTSLENCYERSLTSLGSTLKDPSIMVISDDFFSDEVSNNRLMYNWNKVLIRYCDGGSFSGNSSTIFKGKKLHFRGSNILKVIFEDIYNTKGLNFATDIVIAGCSAGALSVILHVDYIREAFLPNNSKVVALPDSGFFLDYVGFDKNYHKNMQWVFENMNSSGGVNEKCIEFYPLEKWKCFFAEHSIQFIKTPIFMLQSKYDVWQTEEILGEKNYIYINTFGDEMFKRLRNSLFRSENNSGFISSCNSHCGVWTTIRIDNLTQEESFFLWYNDIESKPRTQNEYFPCFHCCQLMKIKFEYFLFIFILFFIYKF